MRRFGFVGTAMLFGLASAGCDKTGSCEYRYDEGSKDGSIPAGMEVCAAKWDQPSCNAGKMSAISLGLKTSGFVFTKGATCEARGYKDCSAGAGVTFYKECANGAAKPGAAAGGADASPRSPAGPSRTASPGKTTLDAPIAVPADAPFRGPADAKTVWQVFLDFDDPFSARFMKSVDEVLATRKDVKLVFRHNPLPFHKDARLAHQAALEARAQKGNEGFWEMFRMLFAEQRKHTRTDLDGYATTMKLDPAAFKKALDTGTHAARVEQDVAAATAAGIASTPISVVGTKIARGAVPKTALEALLSGAP